MVALGERLQYARQQKGLTIAEVAKTTKIKPAFLTAIEEGKYQDLPPAAYAQGFVSNYADFLGLSKKEMLALFRREFDSDKQVQVLPEGFSKRQDFSVKRKQIKQGLLLILLSLMLIGGYILFQFRGALTNPSLEITIPKENQVIVGNLEAQGITDPNATLFVNNDPVALEKDGSFKKNVDTFTGSNTITFRSVNRFGKETIIKRHVEIKPQG